MRKGAGIILAAACMLQTVPFAAAAAEKKVTVEVTVRTADTVLEQAKVSAGDENGDGHLTVEDILIAAHNTYYKGGAAAGYARSCGDAPELSKIWGVRGRFVSCMQDADGAEKTGTPVNGDQISVLMQYADPDAYRFCYNAPDGIRTGEYVNLKLMHRLPDTGIEEPVSDAVILLDGLRTAIRTDENGYAAVSFREPGVHTLSAKLNSGVLLSQSENVNVRENPETTAENDHPDQQTVTSASVTSEQAPGTNSETIGTTVSAAITKLKTGSVRAGESAPLAAFCGAGAVAMAAALICGRKKDSD